MSEEINDPLEHDEDFDDNQGNANLEKVIQVSGMYNEWFLDYASYVILERAVPHVYDGFKPVQRRILHSLKELDDGRFHKVANVIGNTMKYHPHGDAAIGDAMVQVGQKEILLDMQGNWGNILTGDRAAAPRYIEVKLSKFALEVIFNAKTTNWLASYDGRNDEPETLPAKFPILLAHGVEGIAVGLACKILPHNFVELIDGSIDILKGKKVTIVPDFQTGGQADFSNYNDGLRGGRVKVRARIKKVDDRTLCITEVPYNTTTTSLIDSILKANDRGKIKVRKVEDNTAEFVEILVHLPKGVSPDKTIDGLFAFSDCEISIAPNSCVIEDDRPKFLGVAELLTRSTERTKHMLKWELEIRKGELEESWHFSSLEKIFIEKRVYRDIEECETWDEIIATIHKGLKPHIKHLLRAVTDDDVARLTEIKIKRISRFDGFKADEKIRSLEEELVQIKFHLANLTDYAIAYFKNLKTKYSEGRERKTEIATFDTIVAARVAVSNEKLHANLEEGFIGIGLKRGEGDFISECSDIDDVIVIRADGKMMVTKVSQKAFVGKNIIHLRVWKKGDTRMTYNLIFSDGKNGPVRVKRFGVNSITRDKEYDLTKGTPGSEVLYFTANPNGEAEVVTVLLRQIQRVKKLKFDFDFAELAIKGRAAGGNMLSKYPVKRIEIKEKGISTLGARKIWFDDTVRRLNADQRGKFLGEFRPDDMILVLMSTGEYVMTGFDLSTHFADTMIHIEKWISEKPISAVYYDGEKETWFVKRFMAESSTKPVLFITENEKSRLAVATTQHHPMAQIVYNRKFKQTRDKEDETIDLCEFISVKGIKALGNKLSMLPVKDVELGDPNTDLEAAGDAMLNTRPSEVEIPEDESSVIEKQEDQQGKPIQIEEETVQQNPDDVEFEIEVPKGDETKPKTDSNDQRTLFDE
ncbi:MAG: topoisomerase-4 subunit A [Litorivivens sp.]|jgi:topoisomerase-4 subunit A